MKVETSDEDLVRAARLGDVLAFRGLVERHRRRIFSLALRMCGDRAEAEDMAQEAFLRIYRGLPGFRGESAVSTWMTRVALNAFYRHLRRLPRTLPLEEMRTEEGSAGLAAEAALPASGPDAEARLLASEEAGRIRRLVADLPPHFRDAVTLFYLEDRSLEEASAVLGVSTGTLKSRLFRAREILLRRWRERPSGAAETEADEPAVPPARAGDAGRSWL